MKSKPASAAGYSPTTVQLVQSTTLYIATKLGDLRDDVVIVGGLVPSLIVTQDQIPTGKPAHIGTMDVDLGLAIAILEEERYRELCERLRSAGFVPDLSKSGRPTLQRWSIEANGRTVTLDFLIPATRDTDRGGTLRHFEEGFAAIITPGLELAFEDRRLVALEGKTVHNEIASREVWVCEAGAFTVLKSLAFDGRGENKDAYDLVYLLEHYGSGVGDVFQRLKPLLGSPSAQEALRILERDFAEFESLGPKRVAEFLGDPENETVRADAAGVVRSLLTLCRASG